MRAAKSEKKPPVVAATKTEIPEVSSDDKHDFGHDDSGTASATVPSLLPVDVMTSRDFQMDASAHIEVIHQVLKDTIRVQNFRAAILHNKHLFKGKCVLDICCGVGILSLFAAKAGAAKVYAIDSSNVVHYARQVASANGYDDVIEVIKGKIEDVELPVKEVDIIVSDWMGYSLLFQSKCQSVIYARDKWLKKNGGIIFPDQAKLFIVALEDGKHKNESIEWWKNVYGFNMNCLRDVALKEPRFQLVKPQQVLSTQFPIKALDLNTATRKDLGFRSKYMLPMQRSGRMDGFSLYFHTYFTKSHTPLGFSTDPWSAGTNWMQTIFFFDQSLCVKEGELYYGGIEFCPVKKSGELNDIIVNLELLKGDPAQADVEMEMSWRMKPAALLLASTDWDDDSKRDCQNRCVKENGAKGNGSTENAPNFHNLSTADCDILSTTVVVNETTTIATNVPAVSPPPAIQSASNRYDNSSSNSFSITIGEHNYPCRRNRRNKHKHNKKG